MDLRALRYFVAAAETQNLSRAAEGLNIVQSALSHQIRSLETELGAALFERHGRRLRLSAIGALFLDEARGILAEVERARRRVARAAAGDVGTLRVGFQSVSCRTRGMSESLLVFRDLYPGVELKLSPMTGAALLDAIAKGDLDAGFVHLATRPAELEHIRLETNDWLLALPRNHPLARRRGPIRLADLADEPFIWLPRAVAPLLHDRMLAQCQAAGFTPRVVQEAFEEVMMVNLVSVGMGLSFVVDSARGHWPGNMVAFRPVKDFSLPLEMSFAWRRDNDFAPLRRLADIVRQHAA